MYEIMELPLRFLSIHNVGDFSVIIFVDYCLLSIRLLMAHAGRCIAVEHRDVEDVVFPDYM